MPTYRWDCPLCKRPYEGYRKISQRHMGPQCGCGTMTKLAIVAPMIQCDIPAYQSPIDGRPIESRKQRMEDFKRNDCRPWEGLEQEKKVAAQKTQYIEDKKEAVLDKAVHEAFYELPQSKRDVLKWHTEHS